jgi:phosphoribosylformylglycinamidine cyclo-ligase
LDYIAVGKNYPEKVADIVKGVAEGCVQAGCALIGGETAEMPGFYPVNEYDVAGFVVGIIDKKKIIDGRNIKEGDVVIGLPSSGIHSNGYSLVRKLLSPSSSNIDRFVSELGCTLGEELLKPTKIYVKTIQSLIKTQEVKGIANITGGGFIENIPRIIPEGLRVKINKDTWPVLPIFEMLQRIGEMNDRQAYNTFNMGIGMVVVVDRCKANATIAALADIGEKAYTIGEIIKGEAGVDIC